MKRFFQIAGPMYVIFAICVAHFSLVTIEAAHSYRTPERCRLVTSAPVVFDNQRLYESYTGVNPYFPYTPVIPVKPDKQLSDYRVEAWVSTWCAPCKRWQQEELPALLSGGVKVTVHNIDKEKEPADVRSVPTIRLYFKGKFVRQMSYWKALELMGFISVHSDTAYGEENV